MEEILQFIAIETFMKKDSIKTIMTFTPAAIDLIKEGYGVDKEDIEEMVSATIEQNKKVWENLDDEKRDYLMDSIIDQVACERFTVEEMGVEDYISMIHTSTLDGEIKITILTKEPIGFI